MQKPFLILGFVVIGLLGAWTLPSYAKLKVVASTCELFTLVTLLVCEMMALLVRSLNRVSLMRPSLQCRSTLSSPVKSCSGASIGLGSTTTLLTETFW